MNSYFARNENRELVQSEKPDSEPKTPNGITEFVLKIKPRSDAERDAHFAEQLRRENYSKILRLQAAARPPERQWNRTSLDRAGPWGERERSLCAMLGRGFLVALIGIRGNGKTQLGAELIRYVTSTAKPARYASATEFFMDVKASYRDTAAQAEREVVEGYRKPSLLVLDEAGQRAETEWENRLLFELINKRYADMRDTLLIANQSESEFLTSIGPSLASRMHESGGIIQCDWPSFR